MDRKCHVATLVQAPTPQPYLSGPDRRDSFSALGQERSKVGVVSPVCPVGASAVLS